MRKRRKIQKRFAIFIIINGDTGGRKILKLDFRAWKIGFLRLTHSKISIVMDDRERESGGNLLFTARFLLPSLHILCTFRVNRGSELMKFFIIVALALSLCRLMLISQFPSL
jgi:hypothetical protein